MGYFISTQDILTRLSYLKFIWKTWNVRGFVLGSFILQTLLILISPWRIKTSRLLVVVLIWITYNVAEYIANQAVGLIPTATTTNNSSTHPTNETPVQHAATTNLISTHPSSATNETPVQLLAFWAPFLLVHLGGPDTITALAIEDNQLWIRSFLQLMAQVAATGRVFFQSLPSNVFWFPASLMFLAGVIKYGERTYSFYLARLTKFKSDILNDPDPGPNYAKLMEAYDSSMKSGLPTRFETIPDRPKKLPPSIIRPVPRAFRKENDDDLQRGPFKIKDAEDELEIVRSAREFFEKYKGLFADLIFTFQDREESRAFFLGIKSPRKAFKVIEIELNFAYDLFYTKTIFLIRKQCWIPRLVSFLCVALALIIWYLTEKKGGALYNMTTYDIGLTYLLLIGAIALDLVAVVEFLSSDWVVVDKEESIIGSDKIKYWYKNWNRILAFRISLLLNLERCWPWLSRKFLRRKWSESMKTFNLIRYCVDKRPNPWAKFVECVGMKDSLDEIKYTDYKKVSQELKEFIFKELKKKAELSDDPREVDEVCEARGDWVLKSMGGNGFDPFAFYAWTAEVEYDESLLLWHIATELCYQGEKLEEQNIKTKPNPSDGPGTERPQQKNEKYREISKTLSDYMLYLLIRKSDLMFTVAGISEVRFRDTCAEAKHFFDRVLDRRHTSTTADPCQYFPWSPMHKDKLESHHQDACKRILQVNVEVDPKEIKGDQSKSVLFDACRLANKLKELGPLRKWKVIAKVWVELVCYSATHCRADAHLAQLKQGGELITLVWLLMVHFGLGKQFRIKSGHAKSKLVIGK